MKKYRFSTLLAFLLTFGMVTSLSAQYDDLYYDPDTDATYSNSDYDDWEDEDEYANRLR